ncbi:MAG: glucosyltransferase domain-containing protein [Anaerolineaceae bacterium]|nr:glucosyltransferase domain-containing protein [Anaerolineaceae bacterium]MDD4042920.1 glucosyltransferase domain-containing protein [Anaerolineaceae bacterium]MDD4578420.1 glucosyltransferase domain-containing protein [Anaerolineaceae bacterium]
MINPETQSVVHKHHTCISRIKSYLQDNALLFLFLILIIVTAYGFELFNVNLTIDEEFAATRETANSGFITSGRWGLHILTKLLLPKQVIPFIPLALTLCFQTAGMLLLLESLEIRRQIDRILVIAFGLTWPGLAYLYSFSFVNFAVGFGILCISLGLFILVRAQKRLRLLAAIPIAFVFSIYQPLLQPLVMVFLLFVLYKWQKEQKDLSRFMFSALLVTGIGYLLYLGVQQLFLLAYQTEMSNYVSHYFDFGNLFHNFNVYILKLWRLFYNVMIGDVTFYGIAIRVLPLLLLMSGVSTLYHAFKRRKKWANTLGFLVLLALFSVLPFIGGILTKGYIPYRSLLGVPIFFMGWTALALKDVGNQARVIISFFAFFTLFQFASSMNHIFASSAFAYEEDKFLAGQLVQRIEQEKVQAGETDVAYLDMVGFVDRPSTPLISRIENIGASFFGWDGGNPSRAAAFLKTLGYEDLEGLPIQRRANYVLLGEIMPVWPKPGSLRIVDDVVVIKFSEYSKTQKNNLCNSENANILPLGFCP